MAFKEYTGKVIPAEAQYTEYTGEVVPIEGAGAGRGRVNPPSLADARSVQRAPAPLEDTGYTPVIDPQTGQDVGPQAMPQRRSSVLEGMQLPVPEFDAAEAERLSNRGYAQGKPLMDDPRFAAPALRPSEGIKPPSAATGRGMAFQDSSLPVRAAAKAVSGIAEGAGGVMRAAGDLTGINALTRAGTETAKGANEFETGMGDGTPIAGFGPKSPVPYLARMAEGAASSLGSSAALASMFGAGAVIPMMSIQSAGQEYDKARNQGLSPQAALAGAIPKGAFEAIGEKFSGLDKVAGSMGILLSKSASTQAKQEAGQVLMRFGVREIPGEVVTYLGQTGVDLLPGIGLNPDLTMTQFLDGLRDTVVQSAMMGGAMGIAGKQVAGKAVAPQPTAQQMATDKGFLVASQIKRMRDAGDTVVADVMQKGLDRQQATESAGAELQGMATAAPDQAFHAKPEFQDAYRKMRADGMKPAEASARAAITSGFTELAEQTGLTPKAAQAAANAVKDMPLEKVPNFLDRFVAKLTGSGMGKPLPSGMVAAAISAEGDNAMSAVMDSLYRDAPPTDDILSMERNQESIPENVQEVAINSDSENQLRPIDQAAHEAATSPLNDLPEPSDAQKEAGNYKVGRINLHGLAISIENPAGSERSGQDSKGKKWSNTLQSHYGYIRGTEGNDGDHVDTFIGGNPDSQKVFVIDQINKNGSFDEHKILLGFNNLEQADDGYHANYDEGWKGRGAITEVPLDEFKAWVKDGIKTKPFSTTADIGATRAGAAPEVQPAADGPIAAPDSTQQLDATLSVGRTGTPSKSGSRARSQTFDRNPLIAFVAKHGLFHDAAQKGSLKSEFSPDRALMVPGYGPVFRKSGKNLDILTQDAIEEGYLPQDGNATQLYDLIRRAVAGEKILPMYAQGVAETEAQRQLDARQEIANEADLGQNEDAAFEQADENAAVESVGALNDDALFELDDSISLDAPSNVSHESAMRSMGFTEQEISEYATAKEQGSAPEDGANRGTPDEAATRQAPPDRERRDEEARPTAQPVSAKKPTQNPADAGFSASSFKTELRPSGTLAIKGDTTAILGALQVAGVTRSTPMDGGIMVGKSQAQKALAAMQGRPFAPIDVKGVRIGMTPGTAEAVTVKNGTIHIGEDEAIDFESGDPIKAEQDATDAQIVKALRDAGALSRNAKVFGLGKEGSEKLNVADFVVQNISPTGVKSGDASRPAQTRNETLIELRKQLSVLKSIRNCMRAA